jgi:hypothetical protein
MAKKLTVAKGAEGEQTLYIPLRMTARLRMKRAVRATAILFRLPIDG